MFPELSQPPPNHPSTQVLPGQEDALLHSQAATPPSHKSRARIARPGGSAGSAGS